MPQHALTFLDWDRPALTGAARLLAARGDRPGALDLRDCIVVLPGTRAGRRLKELLLEEAERREVPLFPPRMVGVGQLPELLYEPARPLADDLLSRRLWSRALRALPHAEIAPVFPLPPAPDDLVGWETLAGEVQRLHATVGAGGHGFAGVAEHCAASGLHFDDADRWRTLARVAAVYAELLERVGRSDREMERIASARRLRPLPGALHLVGVAEMPEILRTMLRAVEGEIHVVVHAPLHERAAFDDLGCVRPEAWEGRRIPISEEQLEVAGRPPEQAAEAVRALARLEGRFAAEEITIAVPDPSLVPYLEQRLGESGVKARYAGGRPLEASRPYRLLEAAAEFTRGRAWEDFAALLRHPDVGAWLAGPGEGRRIGEGALTEADSYFEEHLPARLAPGRAGGRGGALAALAALEGPKLLGTLPGGLRPLSAWMEPILSLLLELYAGTPLRRDVPEDQRLAEVFTKLRAAAAALHSLPEAADEACDAGAAVRLLLDAVASGEVADEPDEEAVELVGWLELQLDDAPVALICGFNEPFLPESVTADAFLPDALRSALRLEDNARRYARDAYRLTAVLESRSEVTLIAGRYSAEGDPLRPSRLMLAEEGEALAGRVLRFLDGGGGGVAGPLSPSLAQDPPAVSGGGFDLPRERVLTFTPPVSLYVTAFRQLIEDPYSFVLERVLGLEPLDDAAREMDGRVFGTLAHAVLQGFGASEAADSADEREIAGALDARLDAEAARFGAHALPAVRIQVAQLRRRLHAYAAWQAARNRDGWEIVVVEGSVRKGGGPPRITELDVDDAPIEIRGRIDRIDWHPERGEWQILDFKTGDRPQEPEATHRRSSGEWRDLQLPLYRRLAASLDDARGAPLITDPDAVRLGYVLLPRELERTGECLAAWSPEELEGADDLARQLVRDLRRGEVRYAEAGRADGPLAPLLGRRLLLEAAMDDGEEGA